MPLTCLVHKNAINHGMIIIRTPLNIKVNINSNETLSEYEIATRISPIISCPLTQPNTQTIIKANKTLEIIFPIDFFLLILSHIDKTYFCVLYKPVSS